MKVADFGVCKQAIEGVTDLGTKIGTLGYMAPGMIGFVSPQSKGTYTVAVDIWAIGIITMELLLKKHPFDPLVKFFEYAQGRAPLSFDNSHGIDPSPACREFVHALLTPNPEARPAANDVFSKAWLVEMMSSPKVNEL